MKKAWYLAGIASFAFTVCVSGEKVWVPSAAHAGTTAGPNVVNVVAKEYQYEMPDTLPAGPTLFHFTDDGNQLHHVTLVKLEQGKTLADFTALPPGPPPAWVVFMGGPNTPMPRGGQDEDVVDLPPGNYAVVCVIPDTDGKPHMMKGMVKGLTVTPSTQARTMPASDLTLTLTNYAFTFSTTPTAGRHTIRIVNHGTQPHEALMFRVETGKTGEDIANWVSTGMQGPPPGAPVAGISAEAPGKDNTLLLDLSPGSYALLCFMPDAKDGKAHAAHGMIYNFKVS
jgi:uncharacterized protein (DUF2141 family)